eukprot:scaffold76003_cov98-Phaeocystis_antarctica.AAC.1
MSSAPSPPLGSLTPTPSPGGSLTRLGAALGRLGKPLRQSAGCSGVSPSHRPSTGSCHRARSRSTTRPGQQLPPLTLAPSEGRVRFIDASRGDACLRSVGSCFTCHFVVVASSTMAASPGGEWRQSLGHYPDSGAPTAMVASSSGFSRPQAGSVSGNAVSALVLPQVSARTASTMEVTKWEASLANVLIAHNLSQLVEDGKPPTQEAVSELFPNETKEQSKERYHAAMREPCGTQLRERRTHNGCDRWQRSQRGVGHA